MNSKLRDKLISAISILVMIAGLAFIYSSLTAPDYAFANAASIDYSQDPLQDNDAFKHIPPLQLGKSRHYLEAQAAYSISGVLLSKRRYTHGFMHQLSPYDYAIAWAGVPAMRDRIKFKQVVRFALFYYKNDKPVDPEYVGRHFSNNHLIPASPNIRKALGRARKGDKVKLDGYLVNVLSYAKNGSSASWTSSKSRDDDGNGACEIIYVESLQINDRLYR